jgi:peptidoglycan/xylan/chitin deacetylase (PgdA/CDA1 family)
LNLHKGKVPEYRGQPAGFWEIYDGQKMGGVTVHFVDQGLDTGDIVGEACVPVHSKDSPDTLRRKLDMQGAALLAGCVSQVVEGTVVRRPQPKSEFKARTSPTREQRRSVEKKLGMDGPQQLRWLYAIKTLLYLAIYHSGILRLIRAWHRRAPKGRGCIILYHRVNDLTRDVLTISEVRFAEHLIAMGRSYPLVTTTEIVQKVKQHSHLSGSAIAIHFDDCYRDVYTNASRLLSHLKVPACAFISSGFIGTDRVFPHDALKCPFHLENLKSGEVTGLVERGFEIGSHTVNHADLGQVGVDDAFTELSESKKDLEVLLKRSVKLLSYPYGKKLNIRPEVTEIVRKVGYEAMFSAYGGYINGHDNEFDIRRIGVSGQYRALDLLMAIEGVALENLKQSWGESKLRRGRLD